MAGKNAADFRYQRLDPLLQGIALVRKRNLAALSVNGLGNTPGDGAVVGNAHDEAALARHQSGRLNHKTLQKQKIQSRLWHRLTGGSSRGQFIKC